MRGGGAKVGVGMLGEFRVVSFDVGVVREVNGCGRRSYLLLLIWHWKSLEGCGMGGEEWRCTCICRAAK